MELCGEMLSDPTVGRDDGSRSRGSSFKGEPAGFRRILGFVMQMQGPRSLGFAWVGR